MVEVLFVSTLPHLTSSDCFRLIQIFTESRFAPLRAVVWPQVRENLRRGPEFGKIKLSVRCENFLLSQLVASTTEETPTRLDLQ